jgi:bacterioferritin
LNERGMLSPEQTAHVVAASNDSGQRLELDESALEAARRQIDDGAVTPSIAPWRDDLVRLLNDALATELTCVLRYRRHYFTARSIASAAIADEFLVHANDELRHADKLAERIVQLGGEPDFHPDRMLGRSHADYDEALELPAMIRANLVAERVAVEAYRQLIRLVADKDPTTRKLLEEVLADEEEHADELSDWLEG